jgi:LytS/YehU family sensor histidine kinase
LALRAHLDPHFLFNTLNAIAEWCREDGAVAERAVLRLSQMLRAILGGVRAGFWPLVDELELIDTLYELHRLRDPELFQFRRQVPDGLEAIRVPPLILLPVAENAVKHGPAAGHRGAIGLEVSRQDERVIIVVTNPGAYRGPRPGSEGLPTVEKRLQLAYGGAARLRIGAAAEGTRVELELPVVAHG